MLASMERTWLEGVHRVAVLRTGGYGDYDSQDLQDAEQHQETVGAAHDDRVLEE